MLKRVALVVAFSLVLPARAKQLTILHTNDIHSHIGAHGPGGRFGGDDRIASLIREIRATTPNVLLLDAGDWIEGGMYMRFNQPAAVAPYQWSGTADLHMFEVMGYDAIVLGNHDYIDYNHTIDNGNPAPDTVIQRLSRAGNSYPILSYNFNSAVLPSLDPYLVDHADAQPFAVFDVNGVRVAMAGLTEELFVYQMYLADSTLEDPTGAYSQPVIDAMNAMTPAPDVTMLLNHVGHGVDRDVAMSTTGLDLIVGGHSHSRLFTVDTVNNAGTPPSPVNIVQAGEFGLFLGRLDLNIDDTTGAVTVVSYELIPIDQNVPRDAAVAVEVATLTNAVLAKNGPVYTDSVAVSTTDIKHGPRESSIGNLITDAILAKTAGSPWNADLAFISDGGISNPGHTYENGLRRGNITTDDVYRIYGHGYNPQVDKNWRIYLVDYTGADLMWIQETFNFSDLVAALGEGLFLSMAGGQISYDPTLTSGARVTSFDVGGVPIVGTSTYTVAFGEGELAVLDYLTNAGLIPFNYTNKRTTGIEVWQALKDHMTTLGTVAKADADVEGRYRTVQQDLSVENYGVTVTPAAFNVGDTVNIQVLVENFGETASSGGTLEVYVDKTPFEWFDDPNYDSSSLIASLAVPAIPAFPGTTTLTISWDTTGQRPGRIPLYARLTGLSEQNDTNHYAFAFADGATVPWRLVTGPGAGATNPPEVRAWMGLGTPALTADFAAYGATGYGVNVAAGDLDGTASDDEILTGAGPGAVYGPQFRAFRLDGQTVAKVNGYAYGTLRYGVNVSAGDIDGDGYEEIVTGAGPGAVFGPHVRAFNYDGGALSAVNKVSFFAYGTLRYGVNVATGDADGDGRAELVTGAGPSPVFSPQVRGFNYDGVAVTSIAKINFNAYATTSFGCGVAAARLDGDGYDELLTGVGPGAALSGQLRGFDYDGSVVTAIAAINTIPYGTYRYGVRASAGDVDVDGVAEVLACPGPDPSAEARVKGLNFDAATVLPPGELDLLVYDPMAFGANATLAELAP